MKRDKVYILHIKDAIENIEKFTQKISYGEFIKSTLIQSAVIRQLEIIGEASNNLSKEFRKKYNEIPWTEIIGMRNKLIHAYFGVDLKLFGIL